MSKKTRIMLTAILLLTVGAVESLAQEFPGPFYSDDVRARALMWLPEPPELTSGEFANDFYFYHWGITQRDEATTERALSDEAEMLVDVFSEAMGIQLSREATPNIVFLAESATTDANMAKNLVKNYYKRQRPFAKFNEPSLKPETDEEEALTYSYPSGHSANGWMFALVLASIAPDRAEQLFARVREFAMNRVICGHHWKSDIDAGLMLSAGIFATVVGTKEYQELLVKAQQEYKEKTGQAVGVKSTVTVEHPTDRAYHLDGTQANEGSRGIVIKDGKKMVVNP